MAYVISVMWIQDVGFVIFHFVDIYDYPCEGCIVHMKKLIDIFKSHRWLQSECGGQSGDVLCNVNCLMSQQYVHYRTQSI